MRLTWRSSACGSIPPRAGNVERSAVQDLVVAVDGSSSIAADISEIPRECVAKLISRVKGVINDVKLMKAPNQYGKGCSAPQFVSIQCHIHAVQFEDSKIPEGGTINSALKVISLTSDMQAEKIVRAWNLGRTLQIWHRYCHYSTRCL